LKSFWPNHCCPFGSGFDSDYELDNNNPISVEKQHFSRLRGMGLEKSYLDLQLSPGKAEGLRL
jgi:hypothetical protein